MNPTKKNKRNTNVEAPPKQVAAVPPLAAPATTTRKLEILFYGMACFDPIDGGGGYRVLFPNGMTNTGGVDAHVAAIWVRDRNATATARWTGLIGKDANDFTLVAPRSLTVGGLVRTPLDARALEGYVVNLRDCDPKFRIRNPDTILDMVVDRGTLSAHEVNEKGMIVVGWEVEAPMGAPVRFYFDEDFVEVPPTADQVILANVGISGIEDPGHFQLYRKLSEDKTTKLEMKFKGTKPPKKPSGWMKDPTIKYRVTTPDFVCSPVMSRLSTEPAIP